MAQHVNPPTNAGGTGDVNSIPGSGKSPGGGNGILLQYSFLGNPTDGGVWWAAVHGVTKSQTRLSTHSLSIRNSYTKWIGTGKIRFATDFAVI